MADIVRDSIEKSEYEATYAPYSRQSSPSPPHSPTPSPTTSSWSGTFSRSHHDDTLRSVHGSPRVTKTTPSSSLVHRNHQHSSRSDGLSYGVINRMHSYQGPAKQSPSSVYRSSPYEAPRSSKNRPPTVIDRIKTDLKTPNRSLVPRQQHSVYRRSPSPQPMYPEMMAYEDGPLPQPLPTPTLFGVRCTEVSQRAYSGQSSQMKKSFDRLQRMDSGKVEYRTIAFCTHLTVSRWEPLSPCQPQSPTSTAAVAIAAAATASSSSSEESHPPTSVTPSSAKNNPAHAARLMSLANYIRHVLSLTAGIASGQSQAAPRQQQQQQIKQEQTRTQDASSSPSRGHSSSHKTSGSGPIKSESHRRRRYSPDYHHHQGRRSMQHQQQPEMHLSSTTAPSDRGYREGDQYSDQYQSRSQQEYHEQIRAQPQFHPHQHHSQDHSPTSPWVDHTRSATRNLPPLLKIPHPNLTLTLALIYVDRLKAKYPDTRGEPGCSHRLFLVAFIIAAKYRCSVELSPSLPEDMDTQEEGHENLERRDIHGEFSGSRIKHEQVDHSLASFEQTLEARLNAELIFSNHAWVRLLNLGSFYRQPPTATTNPAAAAASSSSTLSQSSLHDQPTGVAAAAAASGPTPPPSATSPTQPQVTSLMSIIHSASGSSPAVPMAMLQVEDLDRMEAEFLTFLNFDLATMSHDLQTCWDLLVGKNEAS